MAHTQADKINGHIDSLRDHLLSKFGNNFDSIKEIHVNVKTTNGIVAKVCVPIDTPPYYSCH